MEIYLYAGLAIVLVLAAVGGFFLVRTRRSVAPGEEDTAPEVTREPKPTAPEDREKDGGADLLPPAQAPPAGATAPPAPAEPELETPPPSAGRMVRLRARLARSQSTLGQGLLNLLSSSSLDEDAWEEIEDTLITADIGVTSATQIVENLRTKVKVLGTRDHDEVRALLREELLAQIRTDADREVRTAPHGDRPAVIMVVGVNGTGKTTTTGKLARVLVGDGRTVVLGAADTFRAAASEQLQTWGSRVGAPVVRKEEGADPASVAFDAVARGIDDGVDTVIIDTAGRLHTKTGLMDELGKVKRVVEKKSQVDEVLLVLDATTGQNGLRQARVFAEVVNVTGIALTKLDGTAKGGIIVQVQRELGVPVKLVGLGEGPDDLAPFDPEVFVDAILG
ncbi:MULTISPECIES: signal recognition particle-docking protein FtsY [unclassified Nocardiopsis]|uniref:signal recognition particle-docking protein FtsY n=1 Tax=Nocardiopsis TaxID=2013 RepID=UPI00387AF271